LEEVTAAGMRRSLSNRKAAVQRGRDARSRSSFHFSIAFFLAFIPAIAAAQAGRPTESQVKAAYLYNFGKFVTWQPAEAAHANSLDICVLGSDPFGSVLDTTVSGEKIDGKQIAVKRLATVDEAGKCSILYISPSEDPRLRPILVIARRYGLLTVSDIPHFAERGGAIGFVTQQNRIRFEINRDAAEGSGLQLSSELLKVATRVIGKANPADH
jgi:hypothetical protein